MRPAKSAQSGYKLTLSQVDKVLKTLMNARKHKHTKNKNATPKN